MAAKAASEQLRINPNDKQARDDYNFAVARIFTIPLAWLSNPSNRWQFEMQGRAHSLIAYHPYDGELLWGATARMTIDFLNVLGL